jgi:hypothetical protein
LPVLWLLPSRTAYFGQIEKTFGKGSIMRMDEDAYLAIPGISTGALSLDLALGGKGIPAGASSRSSGRNPPARPPWP